MASPEDESANESKKTSARSHCGEMERLPNDLIVEIFSRLPSKSVARFCTLSKHWASTLSSSEFAKLFLSKSLTRPRLLFAVKQFDEWQFFSTPQQSQNPSSHLEFHSKFSGDVSGHKCSHASGLFYFPYMRILDEEALLIFNPITGLYVRLPNLQRPLLSRGFLGLDPIDKQFKVLSEIRTIGIRVRLNGPLYQNIQLYQNILTLGTGELSWKSNNKTAEYVRSLFHEGICINGIVYFLGKINDGENKVSMMVCFDVRTEEFNFIKAEWFNDQLEDPWGHFSDRTGLNLVNYKGKLAGIYRKCADTDDGKRIVKLIVWVLEDAEKQKWSKNVYILPENEVLISCDFSVAGVTSNGNIVLVMKYMCKPFYVFYFSPERNTLQSVLIQGFGADLATVEDCVGELRTEVYAYVDHVDDLSVNNAKQLKSNISQITSICPCCKEGEEGGSISNGRCRLYCKEKRRRKRKVV